MTIEEKAGQMTQLTLETVVKGHDQTIEIDPAKLQKAIGKYGVGSILNCYNQALTPDKWQTSSRKFRRPPINSSGYSSHLRIDSIHGANYVQGSTLFPQENGMAATWNPELMKRAAEISAMETRAVEFPGASRRFWTSADSRSGRVLETFGEDPYLAKVMGVAFVRGMEGNDVASTDHVAVSLKHYLGYSFPLNGRDRTSAWIPENYLRRIFSADLCGRSAGGGAHGDGQLRRHQRRSGARQSSHPDRRASR